MHTNTLVNLSDIITTDFYFDGYISDFNNFRTYSIDQLEIGKLYLVRCRPMKHTYTKEKFDAIYKGELNFEVKSTKKEIVVFPTYSIDHSTSFNNILVFNDVNIINNPLSKEGVIKKIQTNQKDKNTKIYNSKAIKEFGITITGILDIDEMLKHNSSIDKIFQDLNFKGIYPEFKFNFLKTLFKSNLKGFTFNAIPLSIYEIRENLYFFEGILKDGRYFSCFLIFK